MPQISAMKILLPDAPSLYGWKQVPERNLHVDEDLRVAVFLISRPEADLHISPFFPGTQPEDRERRLERDPRAVMEGKFISHSR